MNLICISPQYKLISKSTIKNFGEITYNSVNLNVLGRVNAVYLWSMFTILQSRTSFHYHSMFILKIDIFKEQWKLVWEPAVIKVFPKIYLFSYSICRILPFTSICACTWISVYCPAFSCQNNVTVTGEQRIHKLFICHCT